MLVDDFLRAAARRGPDLQALVCGGRRLTYGELDAAVDRVAGGLRALGVRRGDRVAIHLENGVDAVLSIWGAMRAGGVFVPINPSTKAAKLAYVLRDCEPAVLVSDRRAAATLNGVFPSVPRPPALVLSGSSADADAPADGAGMTFSSLAASPLDRPLDDPRIDLDLAALIYTSGSTGQPKGVMLSHDNIGAAIASINGYLQNRPDDVILDVLPLSFDYGLYQLFLAVHAGASVVLERSFVYPTVILDLLVRERVTALPVVPMIAALLLQQDLDAWDLSSLRYLTNTGAVLPQAQIASLRAMLPHLRVFSMYGLTECKRVSFLAPDEIDRRPTSVGKAMDNVEVYLLDADGTRLDRGVGELVVRGANVMQGYWRAPEETARVLRPGLLPGERVLHTGDVFRIDDDGFMYFQHRLDDVIKSRGQKVSPREVEDVLHGAPGISEALVVGVQDAVVGEALKGFVTLRPGAVTDEQALLRHCSQHLEDFMVPRSIEIVAELPRTGSGKIGRRAMQASGARA